MAEPLVLSRLSELPRTQAYLRGLPDGLQSYPECRITTNFSRSTLAVRPALLSTPSIPAALRASLAASSQDAWQPMVHCITLQALKLDIDFRGDQAAALATTLAACQRLYEGPLYRALFFVLSRGIGPNVLILGAPMRFRKLVTGVDLTPLGGTKTSHRARLQCPPHLLDGLGGHLLAVGILAALLAAGAAAATYELQATTATSTEVHFRWAGSTGAADRPAAG